MPAGSVGVVTAGLVLFMLPDPLLRQIPAERRDTATAETFHLMWGDRSPGADLTMTTTIRTFVAVNQDREGDDGPR